ncbi:MAG: type II toxin-antitoxin system RelE/ParE family toxin [Bacteroidales bacterium]
MTSYILFYKVSREREEIEIIRILHQRMDIESRLGE